MYKLCLYYPNFFLVTHLLHFDAYQWWALEPMNELVQQAIEFGLMTHYDRRSKRILKIRNYKEPVNHIESATMFITMKELHFLFVLYAVGVAASIIAFILEIAVYKYRQFRHQNRMCL